MDAGEFLADNVTAALDLLARFDRVFDVLKPTVSSTAISDEQIESLITERNQAKKARNFTRSDEIRKQLLEEGIILEDTKEGTRWKRK